MALVLFESGRKILKQRADVYDEDFVQRCFGTYAIVIIVVLSIITTPGQYFSAPITCWTSLSGSAQSYFDRKCLISGTYPLPEGFHVESYASPNRMRWYPFTPLLVILQIVLFLLVTLIWKSCNRCIGIEIAKAIEAAKRIQSVNAFSNFHKGDPVLDYICENLQSLQKNNFSPAEITLNNHGCFGRMRRCVLNVFSSHNQSSLSNALIAVKILNLAAVLINVSFLAYVLGGEYLYIGIKFFYRMSLNRPVLFHEMFPIMVMCEQTVQVSFNPEKKIEACLRPESECFQRKSIHIHLVSLPISFHTWHH